MMDAGVSPRAHRLGAAVADLAAGLREPHLWLHLAWNDIRNRYRRSTLGPFWVAISVAVYVAAIGAIWGGIVGMDPHEFLPYLCSGILIWNLLVGVMTEGCNTFHSAATYIMHSNRPLSTYAYWVVWRNLLVFAHTFVVYALVALWVPVPLNANTLSGLWSLPLLVLAVSWPPLLLGLISTRYRDIPQIAQSAMTVGFFVTPILWRPEQLGDRLWLAQINPLTHLVEIARAPLLGQAPDPLSVWAVLAFVGLGWCAALGLFARYRTRVAYWL